MKKIAIIILTVFFLTSFSGCETREEKELRQMQEAADASHEALQDALESYDKLIRDIERLDELQSRLK